jgi:hypothetical protein
MPFGPMMLTTPLTAQAIAQVVVRHENTRVFLALAQAGDEEPRLRELFRELADGIVERMTRFLGRLGGSASVEEPARLLHALSVGLAVVDLATGRPDGLQRAAGVLETALRLIIEGARSAGLSSPGALAAPQPGEQA